eukprot:SAG25_NODE_3915_length_930_cov_1.583634_1_plen_119_part_00
MQIAMNQYRDEKSTDNLVGPPVGIQGEGQVGWVAPNMHGILLEHDGACPPFFRATAPTIRTNPGFDPADRRAAQVPLGGGAAGRVSGASGSLLRATRAEIRLCHACWIQILAQRAHTR